MAATLPSPAGDLLDLLLEAGAEAVTLGELEVVGVSDPAAALLELEQAGHALIRVYEAAADRREVTCVRLAGPGERPEPRPEIPEPPPAPAPAAPIAMAPAAPDRRRGLIAALLAAILLVALGAAAAGRARR